MKKKALTILICIATVSIGVGMYYIVKVDDHNIPVENSSDVSITNGNEDLISSSQEEPITSSSLSATNTSSDIEPRTPVNPVWVTDANGYLIAGVGGGEDAKDAASSLAESQVESSVPTVEEIIASMGDEELFNSSSSTASKPAEQQKPPATSSSKPSGGGTDWSQHKVLPGASINWEGVEVDYGRGPAGPDGNLGFS